MKTSFNGYAYSPRAHDPAVRRVDRKALKDAGLDRTFRTEEDAQLNFYLSGLHEDHFFITKTYRVA